MASQSLLLAVYRSGGVFMIGQARKLKSLLLIGLVGGVLLNALPSPLARAQTAAATAPPTTTSPVTSAATVAAAATQNATVPGVQTAQPAAAPGQVEFATGVWPRAMAFDHTNVWIANGFDDTVMRYDESTPPKAVGKPFKVGDSPTAFAWDETLQTMWVAGYNDSSLTLLDPNGNVKKTISPATGGAMSDHPIAMTFAGAFIWVVTQGKDNVWQFNPIDQKPLKKIQVGSFPTAIVASADGKRLWVANGNDDSISVIDVATAAVIDTYTKSIPAFPIGLTFDGTFLWVANYERKIVKLNALTGEPVTTQVSLSVNDRPVTVAAASGHIWLGNADSATTTDVNSQTNAENNIEARKALVGRDHSYAGAVLATDKFIYMADWLNDRVVRIPALPAIALLPTSTPSATPLPATVTAVPVACNPDPNFAPQLKPGDTGRVKEDKDTDPVLVHKDHPSLDAKVAPILGSFKPGEKFIVKDGPFPNADPKTPPVCFYLVQGIDNANLAGYITEGGLPTKLLKDKHYFIEKVSP